MLRINPATALLLLEDHVALAPGTGSSRTSRIPRSGVI